MSVPSGQGVWSKDLLESKVAVAFTVKAAGTSVELEAGFVTPKENWTGVVPICGFGVAG